MRENCCAPNPILRFVPISVHRYTMGNGIREEGATELVRENRRLGQERKMRTFGVESGHSKGVQYHKRKRELLGWLKTDK